MSVNYEIQEYLFLRPEVNPSVPYVMARRLAMLGADMLMDGQTYISSLTVKRGERTAAFSGSEVTPALKEVIALLEEAESYRNEEEDRETTEVCLTYEYRWSVGDEEFSNFRGPFDFCKLLDAYEEKELRNLFYVMWNHADCGEGMGCITAYGLDGSGKLHKGENEFVPVESLPEDADWYCEEPTFIYECDDFSAEAAEACRKLSITGGNPHPDEGEVFEMDGRRFQNAPDLLLEADGSGVYLLNFVSLPSPAAVKPFAEAVLNAMRATGEEEYTVDLLDVKAAVPRMLRVTVKSDGTVTYEMTEA